MTDTQERLIEAQRAKVLAALDDWLVALEEGAWTRPHVWALSEQVRVLNEMRLKGLVYRRVVASV